MVEIKTCWICKGNVADSEEHKFKASEIRRFYGKKFKIETIYCKEESDYVIKSFKDKNIKFEKSICKQCNNVKTQDADEAYSFFVRQIEDSFENIKRTRYFDFDEIFKDSLIGRDNLYKYVAKHVGCRIYQFDKRLIPSNLSEFILGKKENRSLKLMFFQKEGIEILKKYWNIKYNKKFIHLSNGSTILYKSEEFNCFHGWISHGWLTIHWFCGDFQEGLISQKKVKERVFYQAFSVEGRDERIDPVDWIESFNIAKEDERLEFIKAVINYHYSSEENLLLKWGN